MFTIDETSVMWGPSIPTSLSSFHRTYKFRIISLLPSSSHNPHLSLYILYRYPTAVIHFAKCLSVVLRFFFFSSMEEVKVVKKRVRDESEEAESEIDSPEVKRLREDLLDGFDDDPELCSSVQDLDSFMKSFEEEITASPAGDAGAGAAEDGVIDSVSDSGESRPDLGYLLEASDDELGIPPPTASPVGAGNELGTELAPVDSDASEFGGEFWEAPGYDTYGFGFEEAENYSGDYVALDGLFDYSDEGFGSGDVLWRPETLPAQ